MLVPASTEICPAGRASCTVGSGALPPMLGVAAECSVRLGRGDVGHRTFVGPDTGPRFCAFCMFGPTSCTVGSGAVPILAAAWSCERFSFSNGLLRFDGPRGP